MGIKEYFKSASKKNILTGAAKVASTTTLIAALLVAAPSTAYASVPAENIIGDAQYSYDRSGIKAQDAQDIMNYFGGTDRYGNPNVTNDEIRKAIELSDILNTYYFSPLYYTNTTKNEVIGLDIDDIYSDYQNASNRGGKSYERFCNESLESKPAIDAYTLFACGTVSQNIKNQIAARIFSIVSSEYGNVTAYPTVYVNADEVYVLIGINGQLQKIALYGDLVESIKASCQSLDYRYSTGINNIGGYSSNYESSFAYNGIDSVSLDSAWLSLGDDYRKNDLRTALDLSDQLSVAESYEVTMEQADSTTSLSRAERDALVAMGYDYNIVNNATKRCAYLNEVPRLEYK